MYSFLRVSFCFFSQNQCLDSRGVASTNHQLSCYLVFRGSHQNQKITGRETMGTQRWFPGQIARRLSAARRVCSSLELPFLILPGNLHYRGRRQSQPLYEQSQHPPATKDLNNGSNGSTSSPYVIVICPQTSCTEGQEGGLGLKTGQDSTAGCSYLYTCSTARMVACILYQELYQTASGKLKFMWWEQNAQI